MRQILISWFIICSVLWLGSCSREPTDQYSIRLGSNSAITPVSVADEWWHKRHQAILERIRQGDAGMIWIGDSITCRWENNDLWNYYYAKYKPINLGFEGDRTQNVLWRLQNGEIAGINPRLAIIMIGTNNSGCNTGEETGEGIIAICQKLRHDLPNTKILVLGIFPCDPNIRSFRRQNNDRASFIASTVADNKHIYYRNINEHFLDKDGNLSKDIMPDYLHPNVKGYQIWANAINPTISKLMSNEQYCPH
jgi:beta-glucosidase